MKKLIALVVMAAAAATAQAAESNFKPANMSGDAPAAEQKSRAAVERSAKNSEPGFWSREAERSGLSQTGAGFKKNLAGFFNVPGWLKKQEDAYKSRSGKAA